MLTSSRQRNDRSKLEARQDRPNAVGHPSQSQSAATPLAGRADFNESPQTHRVQKFHRRKVHHEIRTSTLQLLGQPVGQVLEVLTQLRFGTRLAKPDTFTPFTGRH